MKPVEEKLAPSDLKDERMNLNRAIEGGGEASVDPDSGNSSTEPSDPEPTEPADPETSDPKSGGSEEGFPKDPVIGPIEPAENPFPAGTEEAKIDYNQISILEGGQKTDGYVPVDKNGPIDKSGVTIGTGVDIGQRSVDEINRLDIPEDLKDKLIDYAGLKGQNALDALAAQPLNISNTEADQLDKAIQDKATNSLIEAYNAQSESVKFNALPAEMQTVIASVDYQHGYLPDKCPIFWSAVTEQRWDDAEKELRNFGDDFHSRREKEADLLHQGIEKLNSRK